MKRKYIIILILIALGLFFSIRYFSNNSIILEGRYLSATSGKHLIVTDGLSITGRQTPFEMTCDKEDVFNDLSSGDKIRIKMPEQVMNDTYPGYILISTCKKLEDGETKDIPATVLHELISMGWCEQEVAKTATLVTENHKVSLDLPNGWESKYSPDSLSLSIKPNGVSEGSIDIIYYPDGFPFDTVSEYQSESGSIYFDSYKITKYYIFDLDYNVDWDWLDLRSWEYIHFEEPYNQFVIYNNNADQWSEEQILELQSILITLRFE